MAAGGPKSKSSQLLAKENYNYDEDVLFGRNLDAIKRVQQVDIGDRSQCVIFSVRNYVDHKLEWGPKYLINNDPRIKLMFENLKVQHGLPIQRFTWPHMYKANYPCLSIAPEAQGKTYTHLLFMVSKLINAISVSKTDAIINSASVMADKDGGLIFDSFDFRRDFLKPKTNVDEELKKNQDNIDFDALLNDGSNADNGQLADDMDNINLDDLVTYPKYIIICSNEELAERIQRDVEIIKEAMFGHRFVESSKLHLLPPKIRTVTSDQSEEKMALRCNESDIIVGTPNALSICINNEFISIRHADQLIFDDLDLLLQLHNSKLRDIIKSYLIQTQATENGHDEENAKSKQACQVFMFSRKWTVLVRQFVTSIFPQRIMIFSSIAEAALYSNMKYELEICSKPSESVLFEKIKNLAKLYQSTIDSNNKQQKPLPKLMIVTRTLDEAEFLANELPKFENEVKLLNHQQNFTPSSIYDLKLRHHQKQNPIYIINDNSIEFLTEFYNDVTHLIHYTLPNSMLAYDKRFYLMQSNIKEPKKNMELQTTILLSPNMETRFAKELYDIVSRSSTTLMSTKLALKDFIKPNEANAICWRWATTGVCLLEKHNKLDTLGSFCPSKHAIDDNEKASSKRYKIGDQEVPSFGQFRVTITRAVNPNEFYFWFESYRDPESSEWKKFKESGREFMANFQTKLDKYRDTPKYNVPLDKFEKGKIYGMYQQQELRVDRIILLEEPTKTKQNYQTINKWQRSGFSPNLEILFQEEYSKQFEVFKIDYGVKLHVYLRNIFKLPAELAEEVEPQSKRGFLLGYQPRYDEPNWSWRAKQKFKEMTCDEGLLNITAWLRMANSNCFWFENMMLKKPLYYDKGFGDAAIVENPIDKLCQNDLGTYHDKKPSFLPYSNRLVIEARWILREIEKYVQFAFLREEKHNLDLLILYLENPPDIVVRQCDFNKQLIELERNLLEDFKNGSLKKLDYFAENVYCLAKTPYDINRCQIIKAIRPESNGAPDEAKYGDTYEASQYLVSCLDHGDEMTVAREDLYLPEIRHIQQLPFQAIRCKLGHFNEELKKDPKLLEKTINLLYNHTRSENNDYVRVRVRFTDETAKDNCGLLLYNLDKELTAIAKEGEIVYKPLIAIFEQDYGIALSNCDDPDLRLNIVYAESVEEPTEENALFDADVLAKAFILNHLLRDMVTEELEIYKANQAEVLGN